MADEKTLPHGAPDIVRQIERADIEVAEQAAEWRGNPVVRALGKVSELADQPPLITLSAVTLLAGLALRDARLARGGARMLASHLLATQIKSQVKHRVDRTRPFVLAEERRYEIAEGKHDEGKYNSFPSGHTAGAVAVAQAVAREYPAAALPARLLAAAVALIQIPRCAHFPSDIGVGAAIGLGAEKLVDLAASKAKALLK
jgi:membrane-associated phospholipid phosphatase